MKERLFIVVHPLRGTVMLKDANGFLLGSFPSIDAAKQWCDENGYLHSVN